MSVSQYLCISFLSPALRMAFLLLLLISATWLLGLMAVNSDVMTFHYLFAVFSCLQVTQCLCLTWRESAHIFIEIYRESALLRFIYTHAQA